MLTPPQAVKVAALKEASPGFVIMRQLAMRFRGLFHGSDYPATWGVLQIATGPLSDRWVSATRSARSPLALSPTASGSLGRLHPLPR
jgi:hypothetical protein